MAHARSYCCPRDSWLRGYRERAKPHSLYPDIVMECRDKATQNFSSLCTYQCFTIPRPTDTALSGWPPITWQFERLEFFSKAGRESESWLIAIRGRTSSPAITDNTVFFITLGHSFLCTYHSSSSGHPGTAEVRLVKYY
jgi:hypothetical protein